MDECAGEERILEWLNRWYPAGPDWQNPKFDCYGGAPFEIKMVSAQQTLEYNLANGGLGQLLWNCLGHWRDVLDLAQRGYELVRSPEHVAAIETMRAQMERDEAECGRRQRLVDQGGDFGEHFSAVCSNCVEDSAVSLFYDDASAQARRRWLDANPDRVDRAVSYVPPGRTPYERPKKGDGIRAFFNSWRLRQRS